MPEPLAFFFTWSTYGTWLPGDKRGWVEYHRGWKMPDLVRRMEAEARMTEDACVLGDDQRRLVEQTVAEHCARRGWRLYAVNCRTNHVHVVVEADRDAREVQRQLKAWCSRRLKGLQQSNGAVGRARENWWAERGSRRHISDEDSLEAAILYVLEGQRKTRPTRTY